MQFFQSIPIKYDKCVIQECFSYKLQQHILYFMKALIAPKEAKR